MPRMFAPRPRPMPASVIRNLIFKQLAKRIAHELDRHAGHKANHVLRELRQSGSLPEHEELKLLQGLQLRLQLEGWGVALHLSTGERVRSQVYEYARRQYLAFTRATHMMGGIQCNTPPRKNLASTHMHSKAAKRTRIRKSKRRSKSPGAGNHEKNEEPQKHCRRRGR